jgi:hypothetical protein
MSLNVFPLEKRSIEQIAVIIRSQIFRRRYYIDRSRNFTLKICLKKDSLEVFEKYDIIYEIKSNADYSEVQNLIEIFESFLCFIEREYENDTYQLKQYINYVLRCILDDCKKYTIKKPYLYSLSHESKKYCSNPANLAWDNNNRITIFNYNTMLNSNHKLIEKIKLIIDKLKSIKPNKTVNRINYLMLIEGLETGDKEYEPNNYILNELIMKEICSYNSVEYDDCKFNYDWDDLTNQYVKIY